LYKTGIYSVITEHEPNKYRISTEQSTKLVRRLYKGKAEKLITDSGKSNFQFITLNYQVKYLLMDVWKVIIARFADQLTPFANYFDLTNYQS
jgi:hypothetical protein